MAKKKHRARVNADLLKIPCPQCYVIQEIVPSKHNLLCGDGDCGDLTYRNGETFLEVTCDECEFEFKVEAFVPEYVEAELQDYFDYEAWLDARNISAGNIVLIAQHNYNEPELRIVLDTICKNYKVKKQPALLARGRIAGVSKDNWKKFIDECWDKRAPIKEPLNE